MNNARQNPPVLTITKAVEQYWGTKSTRAPFLSQVYLFWSVSCLAVYPSWRHADLHWTHLVRSVAADLNFFSSQSEPLSAVLSWVLNKGLLSGICSARPAVDLRLLPHSQHKSSWHASHRPPPGHSDLCRVWDAFSSACHWSIQDWPTVLLTSYSPFLQTLQVGDKINKSSQQSSVLFYLSSSLLLLPCCKLFSPSSWTFNVLSLSPPPTHSALYWKHERVIFHQDDRTLTACMHALEGVVSNRHSENILLW